MQLTQKLEYTLPLPRNKDASIAKGANSAKTEWPALPSL